MGPIILPLDGYENVEKLLEALGNILSDPVAKELIGYIKINDAVHMQDTPGPVVVDQVQHALERAESSAGIFLDLKLPDTSGTNVNIMKRYLDRPPDILTVRDSCSASSFLKLRQLLPKTKLALVSALTDMPIGELQARYGMMPALKIFNDIYPLS